MYLFQVTRPGASKAATPKAVINVSLNSNFLSSGLYSAFLSGLYR